MTRLAFLLIVLLLTVAALPAAAQSPTPIRADRAYDITWDMVDITLDTAQNAYTYQMFVDGAGGQTVAHLCGLNPSTSLIQCATAAPALTPGPVHLIEMTTTDSRVSPPMVSGRSAPLAVQTLATPSPPVNTRLIERGQP